MSYEKQDIEQLKIAYTAITSLLASNEALSDLLVVMAHAFDDEMLKALTLTAEWQKYLDSKRELEKTRELIEIFSAELKKLDASGN
ncbi:MAG: hypothetical protein C4325_03695 [Blastocatellia bacterium]